MALRRHVRPRRAACTALFLVAALLCGCDDAAEESDSSTPDMDASIPRPTTYRATLVPAISNDASVYIAIPHQVSLLDDLGNALNPPVETTSGPEGEVELPLPPAAASIYVIGVGQPDAGTSTYDTVVVNQNWSSGDPLLRISNRNTLLLAIQGADFTARADRASLRGTVYWSTRGVRQGTVGCAKVYIDGADAPDEDQVQRYGSLLPVPLATQDQTNRVGTFYFGNIKIGLHSLRVSLDNGVTMLAPKTISAARPRSGALSPIKAILYQYGYDIEATVDPTPDGCPQ